MTRLRATTRQALLLLPFLLLAGPSPPASGVPVLLPEEPSPVEGLLDLAGPDEVTPALAGALALLNQGKVDESIAEVRRVLEREPRSAPAYEILGAALAKKGDVEGAQEALESAVRLEPHGITALRKLGNVQLARGQRAEARATFERVLALDATDRIAHQRLGMIAQRESRLDDAVSHYQQGLVGAPADYVGVKVDLGRLYNARGRYDETLRLLRPLEARSESNAALAAVLGAAYLESGQTWLAMEHLRRLVALRPEEAAAAHLLATAYRRAGDARAALDQARRASRLQADWAPPLFLQGELLLELDRPEEARLAFEKAAAASPDPSLARLRRATARSRAGDRPGALRELEALVREEAAPPEAYVALGRLQQEAGDHEGGRVTYEAALGRFPDHPDVLVAAGRYHGFRRDYERAIPLLEKGLAARPHDVAALRALAWAQARAGQGEPARATARRLVAREPSVESRLLAANVLRETGADLEAGRLYESVLAEDPEQVVALANLSLIRAEEERWDDARSLAQRAAALVPADSSLRRRLEPILAREGDAAAP